MSPLKFIHKKRLYKNRDPLGHWKNRWIQTPQRILMDPCIKQAPVLSKRFWIIPWPLAYNRLELHCVRKIINFWYTFGWKWRAFVTIWDCRTHVRMTSMTSSVERTDLDFKFSVALPLSVHYLTSSKNGNAPGSTTCPLVIAENHRVNYLTSSNSENAFGCTIWPQVTVDMYQYPLSAL